MIFQAFSAKYIRKMCKCMCFGAFFDTKKTLKLLILNISPLICSAWLWLEVAAEHHLCGALSLKASNHHVEVLLDVVAQTLI